VNASSPTEFYLLELFKVLVPVIGIAFILVASIRRYRAVPSRAAAWLCIIAALWLLVTLASRLALSAPVRKYFLSAAMARLDPEHLREPMYFAVTSWLWTADEVMLLLFGVALLLVAWRADRTHLTNR
jgi:small-conductance mechanosensitive channel